MTATAKRTLPVLREPVDPNRITEPDDRFPCEPYKTIMFAHTCAKRQAFVREGLYLVEMGHCRPTCVVGRLVDLKIGPFDVSGEAEKLRKRRHIGKRKSIVNTGRTGQAVAQLERAVVREEKREEERKRETKPSVRCRRELLPTPWLDDKLREEIDAWRANLTPALAAIVDMAILTRGLPPMLENITRRLLAGQSMDQIAADLLIRTKSVKDMFSDVYRAFGVGSRNELSAKVFDFQVKKEGEAEPCL